MAPVPPFCKRRSFVGAVCAALVVSIVLYRVITQRVKQMNYASAVLTIREHPPAPDTKIPLDAAAANRLATFFPQLGTRRRSGIAGAWLPTVEVAFKAADGAVTHVTSNFEVWSEGHGDWAAQPGLEAHVAELGREAERKSRTD